MSRTNDLSTSGNILAGAYGLHLVNGFPIVHDVQALTGEEKQVTLLQGLGEGPWDGPQEVSYKAHLIDPASYHFHPGTLTKGTADPQQGVDSFFPDGIPYNASAYIGVRLEPGLADEDDYSELQGIYRCLKVANYNASGQQVDANGNVLPGGADPNDYLYYSANPARVAADLIIRRRGLPTSVIDWANWVAWRDYCEQLIPWVGGFSASLPTTFKWLDRGNMSPGAGTSVSKTDGTSTEFDAGTTSENYVPAGAAGSFQWTAGAGRYMCGFARTQALSAPTYTSLTVGLYMETGGQLKLYLGGTYGGDVIGTWTTGDTFRIDTDGTSFSVFKNGVALSIGSHQLPPVPSVPLYAAIAARDTGSSINTIVFSPLSGGSSGATRYIPRFESHIAFTQPTDLQSALDQVCFMAAATWQDGPKIRFFTPEPPAALGATPSHAAQRQIVHHFNADLSVDNIVKRTIKAYPIDARQRLSRLEGKFRDIDHKDLIEDSVFDTRDDLHPPNRRVDPGPMYLGSMNRHQATRLVRMQVRLRSDQYIYCELRGEGDSAHVMPGDIVLVSSTKYQWTEKQFMVIDATDVSGESTADEREFLLQEFDADNYYFDDDYGPVTRHQAVRPATKYELPPAVSSVTLSEHNYQQKDDTIVTALRGLVQFAGFAGGQLGRVWIKGPADSDYVLTDQQVFPGATGAGVFEVRGLIAGSYNVKVVTENVLHAENNLADAAAYPITLTGKTIAPAPPASLTLSHDVVGSYLIGTLGASPDGDIKQYEAVRLTSGVEVPLYNSPSLEFKVSEPLPAGTTAIRVYSRNWSGVRSTTYASASYSAPVPAAPTGGSANANFAYTNLVLDWTASVDSDIKQYGVWELVSAVEQFRGYVTSTRFVDAPPPTSGTRTYIVRAINNSGVSSASHSDPTKRSLTITFSAPFPAAGTISATSMPGEYSPNGAYITRLSGRFTFPSFAHAMRGHIYMTHPGGVEYDTGLFIRPNSSNFCDFSLQAGNVGTHTVRIVTEVESTGQTNSGITHATQNYVVVEPTVTLPNASAVTWLQNGRKRLYSITPPVLKSDKVKIKGYEIWTQNPASTAEAMLTSGPELKQLVDFSLLTSAYETRDWGYRSYDDMGNYSAFTWVAYFQYKTFGAIAFTKDTTNSGPNHIMLKLSGVGGTVYEDVRYTVIQTRAVGASWPSGNQDSSSAAWDSYNISGQQVYEGDHMNLPAVGTEGSTVEMRVGKILADGTQKWSAAQTHTFSDTNLVKAAGYLSFGNIGAGGAVTRHIGAPGVTTADGVRVTSSLAVESGLIQTEYPGTDKVTVKLFNPNAFSIAPADRIWRAEIFKHAASALTAGLLAYWPLEEASSSAFDLVSGGASNTLTDNNTVTQAAGPIGGGNSRLFTRANSEFFSLADNATVSTGDVNFGFSLWAYFVSKGNNMYLVGKDASGARDYYIFYNTSTDRLSFGVFFTDGTSAIATASNYGNIPLTTWLHIMCWHDKTADTVNISINNGTVNSTATANKTPNDSATELRLGASSFVGFEGYFDGRLAHCGFSKATSTLPIMDSTYRTQLYNSGVGISYPYA